MTRLTDSAAEIQAFETGRLLPKRTIRFQTKEQQLLWDLEITGQLSDGMWENATPHDHWKPWCDAESAVAGPGEKVGRNFYVRKAGYALTSRALLDIIGGRMIGYIRIYRALGEAAARALHHRVDCDGTLSTLYLKYPNDAYWQKEKQVIEDNGGADVIAKALADKTYDMDLLLVDLSAIKRAMKTCL